jgi:hypothetical protein
MITSNKAYLETHRNKLREMLPELEKQYNVIYIGIFDSYVRGEQESGSDLDILVEFGNPSTIF